MCRHWGANIVHRAYTDLLLTVSDAHLEEDDKVGEEYTKDREARGQTEAVAVQGSQSSTRCQVLPEVLNAEGQLGVVVGDGPGRGGEAQGLAGHAGSLQLA